jgi:deazaflavin-dependent oxidoreductase (nitroreductase family)
VRFQVHGPVGRVVQRVSGSKRFAPLASRVLPPLDRFANRVTGGRFVLGSLLVPSLVLTTTGAKTGQPRTSPLACLPDGDGAWYVVASNFGQVAHPGWSANLIKHPAARVTYRGTSYDVTAHLLDADEKAALWPRLVAHWPTYDRYIELSGGRDLRVFRLVAGNGLAGV